MRRYARATARDDAGSGLAGTLIVSNRSKGIPAAADTVFASPLNTYRDTYVLGALEHDWRLDSTSSLKTRLYGQQYRFRGTYEADYAPDTINVDRARADRIGLEVGVVTRRYADHTLAFGVDLQAQPRRDRAFIQGLPSDSDDAAIAMAVISMARALGLQVVAEGVETEAQRALLAQLQCGYVQGYLYSRPVPAERVTAFLNKLTDACSEHTAWPPVTSEPMALTT